MNINPTRKINRLKAEYVYDKNNTFFVTICVDGRLCILSDVDCNGKLKLTPTGEIVQNCWVALSDFITNIKLLDFVVMPNHFHALIELNGEPTFIASNRKINLAQIISQFKSKCTNLIRRGMPLPSRTSRTPLASRKHIDNNLNKIALFKWQKSFYDHVVRNEFDLRRIQQYIINNPIKWKNDLLNPINENKLESWENQKQINDKSI